MWANFLISENRTPQLDFFFIQNFYLEINKIDWDSVLNFEFPYPLSSPSLWIPPNTCTHTTLPRCYTPRHSCKGSVDTRSHLERETQITVHWFLKKYGLLIYFSHELRVCKSVSINYVWSIYSTRFVVRYNWLIRNTCLGKLNFQFLVIKIHYIHIKSGHVLVMGKQINFL